MIYTSFILNLSRKDFQSFPFLRKLKPGQWQCPTSPCLPHFTSGGELLCFSSLISLRTPLPWKFSKGSFIWSVHLWVCH